MDDRTIDHPFGQPWADLLFKFSNSFYNDARRLGYVQAVLMIAVAGCGLAIMLWLAFRGAQKLQMISVRVRVGGLVVGVLAIFGVAISHSPGLSVEMDDILNHDRDDRMISVGDREAFSYLAELPDARTTTIFHEPDQGTGWAYALNGLHMMFNHYAWPNHVGKNQWELWDKLRYTGDPTEPEKAAAVEAALRAINVKYIVITSPLYWDFQVVPPGMRNLDQTPGFTTVFDNGDAQIFEVDGWRPPEPGEATFGWGPHEDRSAAEDFVSPPPMPPDEVLRELDD